MSYDVYIENEQENEELFWINHTSNTSSMWILGGLDLCDYDNKHCSVILPAISKAIDYIKENKYTVCIKLEPSNKWGTVDTTIDFLEQIQRACREHKENQTAILKVSN